MNPVETITTTRGTLHILPDPDSHEMLEYEPLGTVYHWHPDMDLGARSKKIERGGRPPEDSLYLPVYMLAHSGVTVDTRPFICPWDSGQVGWVAVSRTEVRKEYGCKRVSAATKRRALEVLRAEIETLARVLEGNVYGYKLVDAEGATIDDCWGFIGYPLDVLPDMLDHCGAEEVKDGNES